MRQRKLLGQAGFGLIQIMIGAAVMGVLALGFARLMENVGRESSYASSKMNTIGLQQQLRTTIANSERCKEALKPTSFSPVSGKLPARVRLPGSSTVLKAGAELRDYRLILKNIYLENILASGQKLDGKKLYQADLVFEATTQGLATSKAKKNGSEKAGLAEREFLPVTAGTMLLEVQGSEIVDCYTLENESDRLKNNCEYFNGVYDTQARTCDFYGRFCDSINGNYNPNTGACRLPNPACSCNAKEGCNCVVSFQGNPGKPGKPGGSSNDGDGDSSNPRATCAALGGEWNGARCTFSAGLSGKEICEKINGKWIGGKCQTGSDGNNGEDNGFCSNGDRMPGATVLVCGIPCTPMRTCQGGRWQAPKGCENRFCSCFTAETKIRMADGSLRAISQVRAGDRVMGRLGVNRVLRMEKVRLGGRKLYAFNGGQPFVTEEHPFWSVQGWKSISPAATLTESPRFGRIESLAEGDVVWGIGKGWIRLERIEAFADRADLPLYNLILDGDHTYYADGYLVHNKD